MILASDLSQCFQKTKRLLKTKACLSLLRYMILFLFHTKVGTLPIGRGYNTSLYLLCIAIREHKNTYNVILYYLDC